MLEELLATPAQQRNKDWLARFFMAVPDAPLFVLTPQRMAGPDHFPYFRLALHTDHEGAQACSLREILDYCTDNGLGIVLTKGDNPDEKPAWVFSLGNLVSLRLYNRFDGDPADLADIQKPPSSPDDDPKIMIATPSEDMFPSYARKAMRAYLTTVMGWQNPEIMMVISPILRPGRNIMLNLPGEAFRDNDHITEFLTRISWYLPPGRGLMIAHPDLYNHPARKPL